MGTRSLIGILESDGSITSIYCHWDGYLSHHGPILSEGYATEEKVRALMALGNLSSLGRQIGEKHDFDERPDDTCTAYGRDRGESDVAARRTSHAEFASEHCHTYLFNPASKSWTFIQRGKTWPLQEAIKDRVDEDDEDDEDDE